MKGTSDGGYLEKWNDRITYNIINLQKNNLALFVANSNRFPVNIYNIRQLIVSWILQEQNGLRSMITSEGYNSVSHIGKSLN